MDLIRLLRSLEEFLYELVGWLVFYPRTFWRIICRPAQMAIYTREELGKPLEARFQATISPVLMLILTVALAHAMELASRASMPALQSPVGRILFGSEEGIMLTRSAIFCVYALGAALGTLRQQNIPVTRETLREPFSIQAFLACPFVLALALGELLLRWPGHAWVAPGLAVHAVGVLWYLWARAAAYRALNTASWAKAFGLVLGSFVVTTAVVLAVAMLVLV
ncbi:MULTISPECIES: hypothetical protein [Stenotrophomonas]|uniref:hypothetical protein n=1 Tax=Stenotrophomonas TaxID=40323 RepID=UPI000872BD45|nr:MULTISPECIES: hypothetical protein [Stenotrophomonas]OEZ00323.1 hypothetical protein BIY45_12235 [Stenotrophomonas sp. BIIR7]